jgi:hypothetical protein
MKIPEISSLKKLPKKGRRPVSGSVALAADAVDDAVPLPPGLAFRSERERVVWAEFTRARPRGAWRSIDLWYVLKMVRLWVDAEETENEIAASGRIVRNERGTPVVNPLIALHDSQLRLQLTLGIRLGLLMSAGIGPDGSDPRDIAAAALTQARLRQAYQDADDLIPKG